MRGAGVPRRRLISMGFATVAVVGCGRPARDASAGGPTQSRGASHGHPPSAGTPAWASSWGEVRVSDDVDAVVVSSVELMQQTHDDWADAARAAASIVRAARLGAAEAHGSAAWDGRLVVGLPGTADAFASASGLGGDLAGRTAAVTIAPPGERPRTVGNVLGVGGLNALGLVTLLVHEGVHQATTSPRLRAPRWLVEGVAVQVAEDHDPAVAAANRNLLPRAPAQLPTQAELDGPDAAAAYAAASVAMRGCEHAWGRPAVMGWLARWEAGHPGIDDLTAAYRAELGRRLSR